MYLISPNFLDERENNRDAIVGKIMYSREPDGTCYNARLKNCTKNGMEFVTDTPYLKNTRLFLHSKNKDDTTIQKAEVTWSKPEPSDNTNHPEHYRVGVRFIGN